MARAFPDHSMVLSKDVGDFRELRQLVLHIERDLVAQTHLRDLLAVAGSTLARHKEDLRMVNARIVRAGRRAKSKLVKP
jgi:hypothetical protein